MVRGTDRHLDLCLAFRRRKTGETLLVAGGVWDRYHRCFIRDRKPGKVKVIYLEESQVEFVRWFACFLDDLRNGRPRDISLALAAGDRRGGKTYSLLLCTIAMMIDCPAFAGSNAIGWVVSASYQEKDEIDKTIEENIPAHWYTARKAPEYRYYFANGAVLRNVSADDPESLRRGRVDIVLYNEAQKVPVSALANGIFGTSDKGGLVLLAANPPRKKVGEWVRVLREAIDEERIGGVKYFGFSSKDNTQINKPSRARAGAIVRLLDARQAQADDEGLFLPIGDRAYPYFQGKKNLGPIPESAFDVTRMVTRNRVFREYDNVGGADFQVHPWNAAVAIQAYGDAKEPTYYVVGEWLKDGSEDQLLDEIYFDGRFQPENTIFIGDASGTWQDASHQQGSGQGKGRVSFDFFKARRWRIEPPQKKKSDRGEHPRNPDIGDRLNLVNKLLATGRLVIDPVRCPRLAESLRECELAPTGKPRGKHAHVTDALGYPLYWLEPRPIPYREPMKKSDLVSANPVPKGPRTL